MDGLETAGWKNRLSWAGAVPLAALFLVSGLWKVTGPMGWAVRIDELRVPHALSLAAALGAGIAETVGAVWILLPRFRRWGAVLVGLLLVVFMAWFALQYGALRGADCSCFPFAKRVVGPGFFAGDLAMLAMAVLAGVGSRRPSGGRQALAIVATVAVFALASYGVEWQRQTGAPAPAAVTVNGQPYDIGRGRFFLFFFNPQCSHCADAAKRMAQMDWRGTTVIALPIEQPQFAEQFLEDSGLRAVVSTDFRKIRQTVGYVSYPYGVAVENGRQKARLTVFDAPQPESDLRRLGFAY